MHTLHKKYSDHVDKKSQSDQYDNNQAGKMNQHNSGSWKYPDIKSNYNNKNLLSDYPSKQKTFV